MGGGVLQKEEEAALPEFQDGKQVPRRNILFCKPSKMNRTSQLNEPRCKGRPGRGQHSQKRRPSGPGTGWDLGLRLEVTRAQARTRGPEDSGTQSRGSRGQGKPCEESKPMVKAKPRSGHTGHREGAAGPGGAEEKAGRWQRGEELIPATWWCMRREQGSRGRSEAPDCGRGRPPAAVDPTSAALPRGLWRLDTGRSGARAEVAGSPAQRGQGGQGATEDTGRGRAERREPGWRVAVGPARLGQDRLPRTYILKSEPPRSPGPASSCKDTWKGFSLVRGPLQRKKLAAHSQRQREESSLCPLVPWSQPARLCPEHQHKTRERSLRYTKPVISV